MIYRSVALTTPSCFLASTRREWVTRLLSMVSGIGLSLTQPGVLAQTLDAAPQLNSQSNSTVAQTRSRPVLQVGSEGAVVTELQGLLKLWGYYTGVVDGLYQEETVTAVVAFQQAAGLSADGIVGPRTWTYLLPQATTPSADNPIPSAPTPAAPNASPRPTPTAASPQPAPDRSPSPAPATDTNANTNNVELPTLRLGMRGSAIESLQERLRVTGFLNGAADGIFGSETQAAVIAFQRTHNLSADGVVGIATWSALFQTR